MANFRDKLQALGATPLGGHPLPPGPDPASLTSREQTHARRVAVLARLGEVQAALVGLAFGPQRQRLAAEQRRLEFESTSLKRRAHELADEEFVGARRGTAARHVRQLLAALERLGGDGVDLTDAEAAAVVEATAWLEAELPVVDAGRVARG